MATIYGLFWNDGFEEKCFWIGRTTSKPPQRRWAARGPCLLKFGDVGKWLYDLFRLGVQPEFCILQRVDGDGHAEERAWIKKMADRGEPLLNVKLGEGKGSIFADFLPHASVARARLRRTVTFSPEHRAKLSDAAKRRHARERAGKACVSATVTKEAVERGPARRKC